MIARRAAVLLETIVALAIVMGVAAFSIQAVDGAEAGLDRADRRRRCMDAAASVAAMIDAGLVGIGDLRSSRLPEIDGASLGAADGFALEMTVETTRTKWAGILEVQITVREEGSDPVEVVLVELARLREHQSQDFTTDDLLDGLQ